MKNIKVTQALSYEVNWLSKQKREAKRESKGIKTPPPNLKLVRFIDFRVQVAQQRATLLSMSTKSKIWKQVAPAWFIKHIPDWFRSFSEVKYKTRKENQTHRTMPHTKTAQHITHWFRSPSNPKESALGPGSFAI